MDGLYYFTIYLLLVVLGVLLEIIFAKLYYKLLKSRYKEHHFYFGRYIFFLSFPALAFFLVTNQLGFSPLVVFLVFAFLGTLLEGLVGYSYYLIVGQRLWTYKKYSIGGYTSFLATPIWGLLGILTWLLAKSF